MEKVSHFWVCLCVDSSYAREAEDYLLPLGREEGIGRNVQLVSPLPLMLSSQQLNMPLFSFLVLLVGLFRVCVSTGLCCPCRWHTIRLETRGA